MYKPRQYQLFRVNGNVNGQLKNLWNGGIAGDWRPETHDFYEPRKSGKMVRLPSSWMQGFWINSNRAKKFSASVELYYRIAPLYAAHGTELAWSTNYRFNNKLSAGLSSYMEFFNNSLGFAYIAEPDVIMGLRDRRTA